MRRFAELMALALVVAACSGSSSAPPTTMPVDTTAVSTTGPGDPPTLARAFPPAPAVPEGPLSPAAQTILADLYDGIPDSITPATVAALAETDDARVTWLIADLLRFVADSDVAQAATRAASDLTGVDFDAAVPWVAITDHLLVWDLPSPPSYESYKERLFTFIEPRWEIMFVEGNAIDDRLLSWGGVFPDDRPFGATDGCPGGCIPALDEPAVTPASEGDWYPDERIVFGVTINGEARAYPKNIMQVHEMVNDTLGGRDFGLPYCTLCGSAQLFFTDDVEGFDRPILRTSGLLSRSNKVMYDLVSGSVFDTFTGEAVSGPLQEAGVRLDQGTVVVSTWAEWKAAHPGTTIVAEDAGIGRLYEVDPLGGRDDNGPIFPIGDRDLRLGVQEQVLGVFAADGAPLAFPVEAARSALEAGGEVEMSGVSLVFDGSGFRAVDRNGGEVPSHQAFWFAWSQFHPQTLLWTPPG